MPCSLLEMNLILLAGPVEGVAGLFGYFRQGYEPDAGHAVL